MSTSGSSPAGSLSAGAANPFPGLRSYDVGEADWFFGREDQIQDLMTRLRVARFVAVVGASGCGKSSLVRAGVVPLLERGFLAQSSASWRIAVMRPGNNPIAHLADALLCAGLQNSADVGSDFAEQAMQVSLRAGCRGIVDLFQRAGLPQDTKLLILVDQFEELFRFAGGNEEGAAQLSAEARAFVSLLLEASQQSEAPICIMLTMRSEFLADCTAFAGLPEAINEGLYLVPRLSRDQLREAIEEPIRQAGAEIENRLVNELLNSLGDDPDQLPILQHALMRLWSTWESEGRQGQISLRQYEAIGTLSQALENHLQEIYAETGSEQPLVELVFRELTQIAEPSRLTRRPRRLAELCEATGRTREEVQAVIERFRQPGRSFLTPPVPERLTADRVIDISHESLIRQWSALRAWVYEEAADRRVQALLSQGAEEWDKDNRNENRLLTGVRLEEAKEWSGRHGHRMRPVEREFLRTSMAHRDRDIRARVLGRVATLIAVVLLIAASAVVFAIQSQKQRMISEKDADTARAETSRAEAETARLAAEAARVKAEELRKAVEAADRQNKYRIRDSYVEKGMGLLKQSDHLRSLVWFAEAINADPEDAADSIHRIQFANVLRRCPRREHTLALAPPPPGKTGEPASQGVYFAQFVHGGKDVLTAAADGKVRIWSLAAPQKPQTEEFVGLLEGSGDKSPRTYEVVAASAGEVLRILVRLRELDKTGWKETALIRDIERSRTGVSPGKDMPLSASVWNGKFSPDGRYLATCDRKGEIKLWQVDSGNRLYRFSFAEEIRRAAAMSSVPRTPSESATEGSRAAASATAGEPALPDRAAVLLEFTSDAPDSPGPRLYAAVSSQSREKEDETCFFSWKLSPKDDNAIAVAPEWKGPAKTTKARLFACCALPSGRLMGCCTNGDIVIARPANADIVVTTPVKGTGLKLSDADTSSRSLSEPGSAPGDAAPRDVMVLSPVLSPDGRMGASVKADQVAVTWADSNKPVTYLPPHSGKVQTLAFSPDGRRLLSAGADGRVRIWDLSPTLLPDLALDHVLNDSVTLYARQPSGLALNDAGQLEAWNFSTLSKQRVHLPDGVVAHRLMAYSPESGRLFSYDSGNRAQITDLQSGEKLSPTVPLAGTIADARFLAGGKVAWVMLSNPAGHRILSILDNKTVGTPPFDKSFQQIADVIPSENERIVAAVSGKVMQVWDLAQPGKIGEDFPLGARRVMAVSNDGRSVVLGDDRKQLAQLWQTANPGKPAAVFEHAGEINRAVFSPDGKCIITCSDDGTAKLWDPAGKLVGKPLESGETVLRGRFSDDSRFALTTGAQGINLWDAQSGGLLASLSMIARWQFGVSTRSGHEIVLLGGFHARQWLSRRDDIASPATLVNLARSMSELRLAPQSLSLAPLGETPRDVPPVQSAADTQWHRWQASDCLLAKNWEAAVWHLTRSLDPSSKKPQPLIYASRGAAHLSLAKDAATGDEDTALVQRALEDFGKARDASAGVSPLLVAEIELNSARAKMLQAQLALAAPQGPEAALKFLQDAAAMVEKAKSWEASHVSVDLAKALSTAAGKTNVPTEQRMTAWTQARSFLDRQRTLRPDDRSLWEAEGALADELTRSAEDAAFPLATRSSLAEQAITILKSLPKATEEIPAFKRRRARALLAAAALDESDLPAKTAHLKEAIKATESIRPEERTATDLRNLGDAHQSLGKIADDLAAARQEYDQAAAWRRSAVSSDDAMPYDVEDLADSLKELGKTLISLDQNGEARKTYDQCRKLVGHNLLKRDAAAANLAGVYIDLGELSESLDEVAESYQWWMNAYQTQSELIKTAKGSKPDSFERSRLAIILEWLADLARRAGHAGDAVRFGRESVDLRLKRLDFLKDADSRNKLAYGCLWLANALDRVAKSQEAIQSGDRQIGLLKGIRTGRSDQETRGLLVKALRAQGTRLLGSRSLADARKLYDEALKEANDMAAAASKGSERIPALRLADCLQSLSALDREAGDYAVALKRIDEAISQYERAISMVSNVDSRESLASANGQKVDLLERLGRFADALAASKTALAMREKLGGKAALAGAHGQLAHLQLLSGDAAAADAQYAVSLKLEQDLAAAPQNPDKEDFEARRRRAQAMESLASRSVACGKVKDARGAYEQAVQLRKRLSDADSSDALAKAACRTGAAGAAALELLAGDAEKARDYSQQAMALSQALVKLDPQDAGNQRSLGLDLEQAGRIALQQERFSQADAYLSQAIVVLEKLASQQPAHAADRDALARQRKWQSVCQVGAALHAASQSPAAASPGPTAVSQRPVEVQRAWALFQAEQLSLDGKVEEANKALEAQRTSNAGSGEGLFDVARAAARCAWHTTGGKNPDALTAAENKAVARFCQQAVNALTGAVKAGSQAGDKFADPELDIVRRTPDYRAVISPPTK